MAEIDGWIQYYNEENTPCGYRRLKDIEITFVDLVEPGSDIWVGYAQLYAGDERFAVTGEHDSEGAALQALKEALDA